MNPQRPTPRHIVIKMANVRDIETILKTVRKKQVKYQGNPIRLWTDFSEDTLQVKRERQKIIKDLKEKN